VLTVGPDNRCNMMLRPLLTDANRWASSTELEWDEIKASWTARGEEAAPPDVGAVLRGEPTILEALPEGRGPYCHGTGVPQVQAATNGIEFAKDPEFCRKAREAGLRFVYLQFDGIGNAANQHRHVPNLFDVKLRAIENLHSAGVDIVPVTTIINGINNEQVGRIVEFALDNPKKICVPVVPARVVQTGRDEEISDERRAAQRYTLADLAHDISGRPASESPFATGSRSR